MSNKGKSHDIKGKTSGVEGATTSVDTILQIIEVATALLRSIHFGGSTDEALQGIAEIEQLTAAGRQAVLDQQGKPIDPNLVKP